MSPLESVGCKGTLFDFPASRLTLDIDESLNRLQEDTNTQSQQEDTIEKGTDETGPLPTKGKVLTCCSLFGDLDSTCE